MLERLVEYLQSQSLGLGYLVVFGLLLAAGFGFPLPEDVPLIAGGVLAWLASPLEEVTLRTMLADRGFQAMVAVGMAGILVGDSVIYLAGRRLGRRVAEVWPFRKMITPEKLERVERLLRQRGKVVVMVARFLPGLRAPTYFTVGHSRVPFWEFLLFDGLAALLSAPLWVALGFWFGDDIERAARAGSEFGSWILGGVLLLVAVLLVRAWLRRRRERRRRSDG
ncbi:MAG TPA: DedA family protein [Anaeromyxobacteraceae bacterium]|nr:DedA family protein [Anaeromyxobacteraceae bacterium]